MSTVTDSRPKLVSDWSAMLRCELLPSETVIADKAAGVMLDVIEVMLEGYTILATNPVHLYCLAEHCEEHKARASLLEMFYSALEHMVSHHGPDLTPKLLALSDE